MNKHTLCKWMLAIIFVACGLPAFAQELDASVNEQVVMIAKKGGLFSFELETTIYKPDGEGPFPLVVINHGKAFGDPRFQGRARHSNAARFFLQRGYVVLKIGRAHV